jgi:hypothetical protein
MWHGLLADIPSGWILCDGLNGTPDLLAKFVEGVADATTDPGATGGATSKDLDTAVGSRWTGGDSHSIEPGTPMAVSDGATETTGITLVGSTISDIRPLFYDVAFIMKT